MAVRRKSKATKKPKTTSKNSFCLRKILLVASFTLTNLAKSLMLISNIRTATISNRLYLTVNIRLIRFKVKLTK